MTSITVYAMGSRVPSAKAQSIEQQIRSCKYKLILAACAMTFLFILILHTSGSVYDMSDNKHVLPTKVKKITHVAANRDYMRNGDDDTVHVKLFEKRKPKSNDPFDATIPRWWANRPESDTFKHPHPPAHAVDGDKLVLGLETRTVFKSGNEVQCEDLDIGMSHEGRLFGQVKDLWMDDDVVLLQIGANDGRTHDDPIYKHYRRARAWRGVFLEPIPYFYNKLQRTYGQAELMKIRSLLLNYVVADKDGPVVMTTLTDAKRKSSESWTEGISSLGENAGDLKRYSDKDKATVKVHGITLQHLLEELRIEPGRLNILQIDAECYDARILLQWPDLEEHRPTVINIEWSCINTEERCQLIQRLVDAGYTHFDHTDKDFTAVIAA